MEKVSDKVSPYLNEEDVGMRPCPRCVDDLENEDCLWCGGSEELTWAQLIVLYGLNVKEYPFGRLLPTSKDFGGAPFQPLDLSQLPSFLYCCVWVFRSCETMADSDRKRLQDIAQELIFLATCKWEEIVEHAAYKAKLSDAMIEVARATYVKPTEAEKAAQEPNSRYRRTIVQIVLQIAPQGAPYGPVQEFRLNSLMNQLVHIHETSVNRDGEVLALLPWAQYHLRRELEQLPVGTPHEAARQNAQEALEWLDSLETLPVDVATLLEAPRAPEQPLPSTTTNE